MVAAIVVVSGGAARRLCRASWLVCAALALHAIDEAATGFLDVYNPTVLALRARWVWLPMPVFTFGGWLSGLVFAMLVLVAITVWVVGTRIGRGFAYVVACT
jgi:hypothetical protein